MFVRNKSIIKVFFSHANATVEKKIVSDPCLFLITFFKSSSTGVSKLGPAQFSSNLPQHTCLKYSSMSRKNLKLRLISAGAKLCRTPALQDRVWTPLI